MCLDTRRGITAQLVVRYDQARVPDGCKRFVRTVRGTPAYRTRIPAQAIAAIAGGTDPAAPGALQELVAADSTEWRNGRNVLRGLLLGLDPFDVVLPAFGADWCAYIMPREDEEETEIPVHGLAAFRMPPERNRDAALPAPDPRAALENGFNMAAAWFNGQSGNAGAHVASESIAGVTLRWIHGFEPVEPAYALTRSEMIVASSPSLIRRFLSEPSRSSIVDRYHRLNPDSLPDSSQIVLVQIDRIAQIIAGRSNATESESEPSKPQPKQKRRLLELLGLVDFGAAEIRVADDHIAVRITLVTDSLGPDSEAATP